MGFADYQVLLGSEVGKLRRQFGVSKIYGGRCGILVLLTLCFLTVYSNET